MNQIRKAFTLIELIIVVVIIGILALVAIPRYFANVDKAKRSQAFATMDVIRQALLGYYAINGVYPAANIYPITVTLDGETIVNLGNPSNTVWRYGYNGPSTVAACAPSWYVTAYKQPGDSCYFAICVGTGGEYGASTCTS
ncbi:MAG: prepilin-type N-terminal cleavage/methylation domain-containing protein [Candidatus Omnitrophota bacterium]|jgi:prepilin-type N-terminal cleavage/methylation domain-containing protein